MAVDTPTAEVVGFSVRRHEPGRARSYRVSLSVCASADDLVRACPSLRSDRTLSRRSSQESAGGLVLAPQRFLFLPGFPAGRAFSRQPATTSCQGAVPEGTSLSVPTWIDRIKPERLHPTPEGCGLSARFSVISSSWGDTRRVEEGGIDPQLCPPPSRRTRCAGPIRPNLDLD